MEEGCPPLNEGYDEVAEVHKHQNIIRVLLKIPQTALAQGCKLIAIFIISTYLFNKLFRNFEVLAFKLKKL